MAFERIVAQNRWVGAASDTKPTMATHPGRVRIGDTALEYDTGVLFITYDGTNWVEAPSGSNLKRIRTTVDIDTDWTSAIAAGDILSNDDCCTTIATYWTFSDVAFIDGGYVEIVYAKIITQVENVTPQYNLYLYDTAPTTGSFLSGAANTHPRKEDYLSYQGKITFPQCEALGANVASSSEVGPSTVGRVPKGIKCAAGSKDLYAVLDTSVGYTHTDNDDITIDLYVVPA